ncbi:MAG: glycosyltransferase family 4 protein [Spirulina sp.]
MTLLVNLAYGLAQPTGTTTYALHLRPYLSALDPIYLSGQAIPDDGGQWISVPGDMTAAQGMKGHLKRLWWTQTQLPRLHRQTKATLLFCPIPEAPLGSGIPYVVTVHDLIPLRFFRPWAPLRLYCQHYLPHILTQAQHILCNSQTTADDLITRLGCPAHRITPIPLTYDESRFRPLNLPTQNYFLCLGRNAPYKNWQRVIAAFAQISPDYDLWMVGPYHPRYTPALQAQAQELGIAHRVKILNFLPAEDLVAVINQAIALVFPSLWEGFGLPILEAMACGTPVLTSNLSAMAEVAGDAALLVDPHCPDAIAQGMIRLSQDSNLRDQLRQAGFQRIRHFSQQQFGHRTTQVLQHTMASQL